MSQRRRLQIGSGVLMLAMLGSVGFWALGARGGSGAQEAQDQGAQDQGAQDQGAQDQGAQDQGAQDIGEPKPEPAPVLFAPDYATGHDRAGFAGRAMVLVFGEGGASAWAGFLGSCEADARIADLLSTRFQGVYVDVAGDPEAAALYGPPKAPAILVKDLRGPLLGTLEGDAISCEALRALLEGAQGRASMERSPAYTRLLAGTDLLDELHSKDELAEIARVVKLLGHFEKDAPAVLAARSRAGALGVIVD